MSIQIFFGRRSLTGPWCLDIDEDSEGQMLEHVRDLGLRIAKNAI